MFLPFNFLCFSSLVLSVFVVVSSSSLFMSWVGLELNLLSFVPLILTSKITQRNSEGAMKYFLVQALSSVILLFSFYFLQSFLSLLVLSLALVFKMAAAPFHFWLLSMVETLNWNTIFLLLTVQKIGPLVLLSFFIQDLFISMSFFMLLSALVGALGGLSQLMLRSILAYSSINHLGWLLGSLLISRQLSFTYLSLYMLILLSLIMIFWAGSFFHLNQISMVKSLYLKSIIFLGLLSVGGLPPFLGFLPKWLVLSSMMQSSLYLFGFILVMSSLFTLYYYIRISFPVFMFSSSTLFLSNDKMNIMRLEGVIFMSLISLTSLPIFLFLI